MWIYKSIKNPYEIIIEDIDFQKSVIFLKRSISKGVIKESTVTKNHNRLVIIPSFISTMLEKYVAGLSSEWLFPTKEGTPYMDSRAVTSRYIKPYIVSLGVEWKTLKASRQTYVSALRNEGQHELSNEITGHSGEFQISITTHLKQLTTKWKWLIMSLKN